MVINDVMWGLKLQVTRIILSVVCACFSIILIIIIILICICNNFVIYHILYDFFLQETNIIIYRI